MTGVGALAKLALARARRRPVGWLLSVVGIAVTLGYAGAVVTTSTIAADRSARTVLRSVPDTDRAVRLTWQAVVTPRVRTEALALFRRARTSATRRGGADESGPALRDDRTAGRDHAAGTVGDADAGRRAPAGRCSAACTPHACPVLLVSGTGRPTGRVDVGAALTAPSVRLAIAGTASLRSALPLGFVPRVGATAPVLLTGDARGLDALRGLDAIYRTDSWVTPLGVSSLHAWQLAPLARRLRAAQQQLLATNSAFSMSAPFTAIAAARSEADATPTPPVARRWWRRGRADHVRRARRRSAAP